MRAFFAIDVPEAAVDGAMRAIDTLRHRLTRGVTFTPRDQIHVTLQFLGDLTDEAAERALEIGRATTAPAFDLTIAGTGAFPRAEAPRVLFLALKDDAGLAALAESLGTRLREAGFTLDDRPYHPHLTLARMKARHAIQPASEALSHLHFDPMKVEIDRFVLFESRGGTYVRRAEFPLTRG